MKVLTRGILVGIIAVIMTATLAIAATWQFYFPISVTDTSNTTRTYYPVVTGLQGNTFTGGGYIQSDGLNSAMLLGTSALKYMIATGNITAVVPNLPSGSRVSFNFYTGYNPPQDNFAIVTGDDGYITIADNVTEPTSNWSAEGYSYIPTSSNYSIGDFSTYTEVDPTDNITTPTPFRINGANIPTNADYYRYKDMGAGFYPVSFNASGEIYTQGVVGGSQRVGFAWTNTVDDISGLAATDLYLVSSATNPETIIIRIGRGNTLAEDLSNPITANMTVYWDLVRTGDNATAYLYSDIKKTKLMDTVFVSGLGAGTTYRYQFGLININTGGAGLLWTGYMSNVTNHLFLKDGIVDVYPTADSLALQMVNNPFRATTTPLTSGFNKWNITVNATSSGISVNDGAYATTYPVTSSNTSGNWTLLYNVPYTDNLTYSVGGNREFYFEPNSIIQGTDLPDRETRGGLNDGVIIFGTNSQVSIHYGERVSSSSTGLISSNATSGFTMPSMVVPSTWFGAGATTNDTSLAALPFYDLFHSVQTQSGVPTRNLYFLIAIGSTLLAMLIVMAWTKSLMLGCIVGDVVLFLGTANNVVPMWIPFSLIITQLGMLYLLRNT